MVQRVTITMKIYGSLYLCCNEYYWCLYPKVDEKIKETNAIL